MEQRTCQKCGGTYPEMFFHSTGHKRRGSTHATYLKRTCIGCVQTAGDELKRRDRSIAKARTAFYWHAKKYISKGLAKTCGEFAELFGWDRAQMAHDIKYVYENGCPVCHQKFGGWLSWAHVTLGVIDPDKPPYYADNVRWLCASCNKREQQVELYE